MWWPDEGWSPSHDDIIIWKWVTAIAPTGSSEVTRSFILDLVKWFKYDADWYLMARSRLKLDEDQEGGDWAYMKAKRWDRSVARDDPTYLAAIAVHLARNGLTGDGMGLSGAARRRYVCDVCSS